MIGGVLGIVLAVLDETLPMRFRKFVPSATGVGIAMVIDANDSLAMFLGAFGAWVLARVAPAASKRLAFSVASGTVAGEGLMGIVIIVLRDVFGLLGR